MIDLDGNLIQAPSSYRDERSLESYKEVEKLGGFEKVFRNTSNQIMPINRLFQLLALKKFQVNVYESTEKLVMIQDLINYYLTGKIFGEKTICSTSQMFDLKSGDWNYNFIEDMGLKKEIFPNIIDNKKIVGFNRNGLIKSLREFDIDVISVASHDTASAVYITESYSDDKTLFYHQEPGH